LCGDSTDEKSVAYLMDGKLANMIFTDPPYNADYSSRVDKNRRKPWGGILNDNLTEENFGHFLEDSLTQAKNFLEINGSIYCWTDWKHYPLVASIFQSLFNQKSAIVWDKKHFGLGTYYRTQYELVLFGVNGDKLNTWNAGHDERDVWSQSRDTVSDYVHPTQKPIELAIRAIKNSSNQNQNVLDLFGGSGSTLVACEKINRSSFIMELDPKYCDVIIGRWERLTGLTATRLEQ
jgi:DNA modification methylase